MKLSFPILYVALVSALAAQNTSPSDPAKPAVAAVMGCPSAGKTVTEDPIELGWTAGSGIVNYRLLLGPTAGSSQNGDTSMITGLKGQLTGLPAGQNLYATLWSYDRDGNAVQPPSSCAFKTAQNLGEVGFKDHPSSTLNGVSLGSFPVPAANGLPLATAAHACQAQCKQNVGCQGYTYYPAGAGNATAMCDLKSQLMDAQPDGCCLSALKIVTHESAPVTSLPAPGPPAVIEPAPAPSRAAAPPPAPPAPTPKAPAPPPEPPATSRASAAPPKPAPTPRPAAPAANGVNGDWANQAGGITHIVQQGNTVKGTYTDPKLPSLTGTVQGTFDGKMLRATLNWKNEKDSSHGELKLTLTPEGRLEGTWTDATGADGPWTMGRVGGSPK